MTAVPALPHLWDGRRLLRFLAGLALLALAFAVQAGLTAAPALTAPPAITASITTVVDVPAAPAVVDVPASPADLAPASSISSAAEVVPASSSAEVVPAATDVVAPAGHVGGAPALVPATPGWGAGDGVPAGAVLRAYSSRGPPQA